MSTFSNFISEAQRQITLSIDCTQNIQQPSSENSKAKQDSHPSECLERVLIAEKARIRPQNAVIGLGPRAFQLMTARAAVLLGGLGVTGGIGYGVHRAAQSSTASWIPSVAPLRQIADDLSNWMLAGAAVAINALREIGWVTPLPSCHDPLMSNESRFGIGVPVDTTGLALDISEPDLRYTDAESLIVSIPENNLNTALGGVFVLAWEAAKNKDISRLTVNSSLQAVTIVLHNIAAGRVIISLVEDSADLTQLEAKMPAMLAWLEVESWHNVESFVAGQADPNAPGDFREDLVQIVIDASPALGTADRGIDPLFQESKFRTVIVPGGEESMVLPGHSAVFCD